MYGIVVAGAKYLIVQHFGEDVANAILTKLSLADESFSSHQAYSERMIPDMLAALAEHTGMSAEDVGMLAGRYFVRFVCNYGYGELLKVSGRKLGDFLKGMDSLHDFFRFSFYCDRETTSGIRLHYRSRRKGYVSYVMGQLMEIAEKFYDQKISITIKQQDERGHFQFVLMQLRFDNSALEDDRKLVIKSSSLNEFLPVDSYSFLTMFPYFLVFDKKLEIRLVGDALGKILPGLEGKKVDEEFELMRPLIKFTWEGVIQRLNVLFQLESTSQVQKPEAIQKIALAVEGMVEENVEIHDERETAGKFSAVDDDSLPYLKLRGPIIYLKSYDMMIYIPTVTVDTLDQVFDLGLYLNDYSNADCNREIMMASVQKSDDLKIMLQKEQEKTKTLATTLHEIGIYKKKNRDLMRICLPKPLAKEMLKNGEAEEPGKKYEEVTIGVVKMMDFQPMLDGKTPDEIVLLINSIYTVFDEMSDRHGVYKVGMEAETYIIACGAPIETPYHAEYIVDTLMDIIKSVKENADAIKGVKKPQVKAGCYSGDMTGCLVASKSGPKYCLCGETTNVAIKMESSNKAPMTIQMGKSTKDSLQKASPGSFRFETRGKLNLKGVGEVETFGILKKSGGPRSKGYPLAEESDDENEEADAYTPQDNRYGGSATSDRSADMSRMSMNSAISDGNSSRMSSGSRVSNTSGKESRASKASKTSEKAEMNGDDGGDVTPTPTPKRASSKTRKSKTKT